MIVSAILSCRRAGLVFAMAAIFVASAFASTEAAQKKAPEKKDADKKDDAAKPALVAGFGDWNVFVGQAGKGRICYTLAQPKTREPASLKRDPGYAFISDRPAEGVRNEVSFIMGFDVAAVPDSADSKLETKTQAKSAKSDSKSKSAPPAAPVAAVEEATFELLPKGANLWVKNAARESELIAVMRKGAKLTVKASSLKGHLSTDVYSLSGFSQAMDRLLKECPGK